jgi:hypothetical protein
VTFNGLAKWCARYLGSGNEGEANACVATGWLNQGGLQGGKGKHTTIAGPLVVSGKEQLDLMVSRHEPVSCRTNMKSKGKPTPNFRMQD